MSRVDCPREPEVLEVVLSGRWTEEHHHELARHAVQCEVCGDVVMVARVLREDREMGGREAHVPAAGQVWWRAAVRARLEAAQAAARPITWIHGLMGASAAGLTTAAVGIAWPSLQQATGWIGSRIISFDPDGAAVAALFGDALLRALPFAIGITAALVLAPIALYFALSDD